MTEKKNRKNTAEALAKQKKDDILLYRIELLLVLGIIGFPLIGALKNLSNRSIDAVTPYFCVMGAIMIAVALALIIRGKVIKVKQDGMKLITPTGVGAALFVVGAILVTFPFFENASGKLQVAFTMVILLGCIYNLYSYGFFNVSLSICISIVLLYFANLLPFTYLELFLRYFCRYAVVPVALCGILAAVLTIRNAKISKKWAFIMPENKFYAVISTIVWSSAIISAALIFTFSAVFAFILVYFIVLFIVLGVICTIKIL